MTDADVIAALNQTFRVALTMWGEGRGGSPELREGIGSTLANRVTAQRAKWGLTLSAVCLAPAQYSCWAPADGKDNYDAVMQAARLLLAGNAGGPTLRACLAMAAEIVAGVLADSVHGATHYYSPKAMVPPWRVPAWAVGKTPAATIDDTLFFAGVV